MNTSKLDEETKKALVQDINFRIGSDINDLSNAYELENELVRRKNHLQSCLSIVNNEVPTKISSAIEKAEQNSAQIESLKTKSEKLKKRVEAFLVKTEPLRLELDKRFSGIQKLDQVLLYLKSFEKIDELSQQMKQSNDDEQLVMLYGELKEMCNQYQGGHRGTYVKEYTHYWHNILKDKITKHYEDVLTQLKWPFVSGVEHSPLPKELLVKFTNITRYLFLIQEPEDLITTTLSEDFAPDQEPSLPVKILLRPLKKRFAFHFTGSRQTARIDRPEWFLTQTLTWIKDHQDFVRNNVQPVADKLELKGVRAVDEFNAGLISLAAERLHTVLATYHSQGSKGEIVDVDAAFAHAVDETLGFNKELTIIVGKEINSILSVLTRAETVLRWLAVEKKYALAKMDETLGNEQWSEPVAGGAGAAVGALLWVPRGADWFISLLKTIEDRYAPLPQPGHRLQFLELQLELIEEWRIRLTQLLGAASDSIQSEASPLIAVINAAHHTHTVLLQWAHSLHYLQLHYYKRQFQHYTHLQHHDEDSDTSSSSSSSTTDSDDEMGKDGPVFEIAEGMSLKEVELQSKKLALTELSRRSSLFYDIASPIENLAVTGPLAGEEEAEEAGVFADAPALLARLRDSGLDTLAQHILANFKANIKDYKRQKWHALALTEERALSVSSALCGGLAGICAALSSAAQRLAPHLAHRLRNQLAAEVDQYIFKEVVLDNWFNTGGTMQFTHDVKRNMVPAFAPPYKVASQINQLPKLIQACKLLNLDYDDARRLRGFIIKQPQTGEQKLKTLEITDITPAEAWKILSQRTDLSDANSPSSVMELF